MIYYESDPLPQVCVDCKEEECYNCDYALDRWHLSEKDALLLEKKMKLKALEHFDFRALKLGK